MPRSYFGVNSATSRNMFKHCVPEFNKTYDDIVEMLVIGILFCFRLLEILLNNWLYVFLYQFSL